MRKKEQSDGSQEKKSLSLTDEVALSSISFTETDNAFSAVANEGTLGIRDCLLPSSADSAFPTVDDDVELSTSPCLLLLKIHAH